jgi:hypothetical protein
LIRSLRIAAVAVLAAVLVTGCESTQDKAARVQKANLIRAKIAAQPHIVAAVDHRIKVTGTTVLRGKDTDAVVVAVVNTSSKPIADLPIAVKVFNGLGNVVLTNTAPGTDHWLNHIPLLRPGQTFYWVNDQLDPLPSARKATVRIGPGVVVAHPYPDAQLIKTKFFEDPVSGAAFTGKVKGTAPVLQERLVIFSVGKQGGQIVAAGRGVLEKLLPNGGKPAGFTIFYVGANPKSVSLSNQAPPVLSPKR